MKLSFSIARRFLKSNISQTIIIILGIAIGISVQIFIGSLIQGLQKGLVKTTIGSSSQITITSNADNKQISDYITLMQKAEKSDSRIKYISPALDNPALLDFNGKSQSLLVRGLDFSKADKIYKISNALVEGNMPANISEVILGSNLKEDYNLKVNDEISIITPDKRTEKCIITGFFDLKVAQINNTWCITTLESAQKLFKSDNTITSIEMQVSQNDVFLADEISATITKSLSNENLKITN